MKMRQFYFVALGMMVVVAFSLTMQMKNFAPLAITYSNSDRYAEPCSTLKQNITDASYEHNMENLIPSPICNSNQLKTIRQHLGDPGLLSGATACPVATWIEKFYKEDALFDHFVGISVGCNKGNDAIRTARMGMSVSAFDESSWNEAFMDASQNNFIAHVCGGAGEPIKITSPERMGEMHCIEPMPSTFDLLEKSSKTLGLGEKNLILTQAAISAANGVVFFPDVEPGIEHLGLHDCAGDSSKCKKVPMYSLDSYVEKFVRSKGPIHVLQIDTEGWDFKVLFGASSVLDRTYYLEFENHIFGNWEFLHVLDAIRLLDSKGFTCYWSGQNKLWRITNCYDESFNNMRGWSNIACVHRSQERLLHRMEELFESTVQTDDEEKDEDYYYS